MGLVIESLRSALQELRSTIVGPFSISSSDPRLRELFGVRSSDAGVVVNEKTALGYSPIFAAVSLIANTLASVPLHFFRRTGDDARVRDRASPLDQLVTLDANEEMSAFAFRRAMQWNALVSGNGYCEVQRRRDSREPAALHLLDPANVAPFRDAAGRLKYRVSTEGTPVELPAADVVHLAAPSRDGLVGLSVVNQARQAIGLGLATEKFGSLYFSAGARMGGVLTTPGRLSDKAVTSLRDAITSAHAGVEQAHRMLILEEGLRYEPTSTPPEESQFSVTRMHQVVEVSRFFNIPVTLLAAAVDGLTYRNAQEESQRFVDHCLLPWATAWEAELGRKLIDKAERRVAYFEHLFANLLAGDLPARYAAYKIGRDGAWLSPNDVRRFENMNPIPNGDTYAPPGVAPAPSGARDGGRDDALVIVKEITEFDADGRPTKMIERHTTRPGGDPLVILKAVTQRDGEGRAVRQVQIQTRPPAALGDGRQARQTLAARRLLEDTIRRALRRESDRARRAAASIANLEAWAKGFYAAPEVATLAAYLEPALTNLTSVDPAGLADSIALEWHAASLSALRALARTGPSDVRKSVENVTQAWLEHRPSAIADAVLARLAS